MLSSRSKPTICVKDPSWHEVGKGVTIYRVPYLDGKTHFAIKGRHPAFTVYPDRYLSWAFLGFFVAKRIMRKMNVDAIFSTFPVASSHLMAYWLSCATGKPWIADFRDPMVQDDYPVGATLKKFWRWIERKTMHRAHSIVFTTEAAKRMYQKRYPHLDKTRMVVIPNGYDEEAFSEIEILTPESKKTDKICFVHAGVLYPWERDPVPLFHAIRLLVDQEKLKDNEIEFVFYGSGNDLMVDYFRKIIKADNLEPFVRFEPRVPHKVALQKMAQADALFLIQAECCDSQIPAKLYEYFRLQKPILALATETGETGKLLKAFNAGMVVPWNNSRAIASTLSSMIKSLRERDKLEKMVVPDYRFFSRSHQARRLVAVINECGGCS